MRGVCTCDCQLFLEVWTLREGSGWPKSIAQGMANVKRGRRKRQADLICPLDTVGIPLKFRLCTAWPWFLNVEQRDGM